MIPLVHREGELQTLFPGVRDDFSNLMNEADMFFENAKRYGEEISFFQDMLEMFDLSGEENKLTRDNFTSAIGAGYHYLNRKEERDRYFTELLASQA